MFRAESRENETATRFLSLEWDIFPSTCPPLRLFSFLVYVPQIPDPFFVADDDLFVLKK